MLRVNSRVVLMVRRLVRVPLMIFASMSRHRHLLLKTMIVRTLYGM